MPRIRIALGVSPDNAAGYSDKVDEAIHAIASAKTIAAIGSCGFNRYADKAQEHAFACQIALAEEFALPLIVEAKGAYDRALDFLLAEGLPKKGVALRAEDAAPEQLAKWVEADCYISLGSAGLNDPLAFHNRARTLPPNRILVESSAPYVHLNTLSGTDPRCDQVVFVADILQNICPPLRLLENWLTLFT